MVNSKFLLATVFGIALTNAQLSPMATRMACFPIPALFTSPRLSLGTKLFSLLTCIETEAKYTISPDAFLRYLTSYKKILKIWNSSYIANLNPFETPLMLNILVKKKLQNIINSIIHNPKIYGHDLYLNELITVLIDILDLSKLDLNPVYPFFDYLEDACHQTIPAADNQISQLHETHDMELKDDGPNFSYLEEIRNKLLIMRAEYSE